MTDVFQTTIAVRGYELDSLGHVNGAVYLQYAEHARWTCLRAAGVTAGVLQAARLAPVRLEETVRYHRELGAGDEVDVSCAFTWGEGKTFRLHQDFLLPDAALAAEVDSVGGLLDVDTRRLVAEPTRHFRSIAAVPDLLGL
ncbi:MAG: acyl-CoA thioesterase [Kutzneria sp.]|nr:acyl-CoA thioesterase [Kutzneria sp.]MBV9844747.1 acyl-CoA thioesterase [Kutzneria sp.]